MRTIGLALLAGALLAACNTTPTVTKSSTTMTMAEIKDAGLECRRNVPIDTNIPRTICASPESWAAYEAKTRSVTDQLLAEGRQISNVGAFNRQ